MERVRKDPPFPTRVEAFLAFVTQKVLVNLFLSSSGRPWSDYKVSRIVVIVK